MTFKMRAELVNPSYVRIWGNPGELLYHVRALARPAQLDAIHAGPYTVLPGAVAEIESPDWPTGLYLMPNGREALPPEAAPNDYGPVLDLAVKAGLRLPTAKGQDP